MLARSSPRPLVPQDLRPDHRTIARVVYALALHRVDPSESPTDVIQRHWRDDTAIQLIGRSAVSPATTTTTGWAAELAATAVGPVYVASLGGAAGALVGRPNALSLSLAGLNTISLPYSTSLGTAAWITEAAPIGVGQGALNKSTLGPSKKIGIIETISEELLRGSAGTAVTLIDA